jgi:hypothetical protein
MDRAATAVTAPTYDGITIEQALADIERHGYVLNIGQIGPRTKRALDKLAKQGKLVKEKACWPWWYHGTCMKHGWRLPQF